MWEKKIKVQPNVRKVRSNVMLVLPNVTIEPSFARKKIEPLNVTKVQLHVILVLHNLKMVSSNVRKKIWVQPNVAKVTVIYDVGIA